MHVPEKWRVRNARLPACGNNGMFLIPAVGKFRPLPLLVVASCGDDWVEAGLPLPAWEHVSISTPVRCPTWEEMCFVKDVFWDSEDVVIQIHAPRSEWVNNHPYCLHLYKPIGVELPRPPAITVGVKRLGVML